VLVLDSFKGHLTQQIEEEMRKANTTSSWYLVAWHHSCRCSMWSLTSLSKTISKAALQWLAPGGEPCPHSTWKAEEAISSHVGGMDPDCVEEDFQLVNPCWIWKALLLQCTGDDILWQDVEDENDDWLWRWWWWTKWQGGLWVTISVSKIYFEKFS
jgi:hypothetical protein